jgi:hypothetical protein
MNVVELGKILDDPLADACKKLWAIVLLLAMKDRATEVRYEPWRPEGALRYKVDGVYYDMVPPPSHIAPGLINAIHDFCHPRPDSWRTRLARRLRAWANHLDPQDSAYVTDEFFDAQIVAGASVPIRATMPPAAEPRNGIVLELTPDPLIGEHAREFFAHWRERNN